MFLHELNQSVAKKRQRMNHSMINSHDFGGSNAISRNVTKESSNLCLPSSGSISHKIKSRVLADNLRSLNLNGQDTLNTMKSSQNKLQDIQIVDASYSGKIIAETPIMRNIRFKNFYNHSGKINQ